MRTIILAAGYATRLEPLTLDKPKSLLEIGGRKIIDRILDKVAALKEAAASIYIISNAKFFGRFEEWFEGSEYKDRVSLINDGTLSNETRLGAIKDLELAIRTKRIDDDILVVAGDNLFDFDLNGFIGFALSRSCAVCVALYDIKDIKSARRFGVVKIDANNRITDFEEKPAKPKSTLISTGIYYFPKKKISFIKEYVKMQDKLDAPGYYVSWLSKKDTIYGFVFTEDWYDIGSLESYNKADKDYFEKEKGR